MNEYVSVLKKYAVFSGRASRREYWMFTLINFVISFFVGFMSGLFIRDKTMVNIAGNLYSLAVLLPSIGVAIRRVHDTNNSGWFILVPIYSLILVLTGGTKGDNKYGPDPYAGQSTPQAPIAPMPMNPTDGGFTPTSPVQGA